MALIAFILKIYRLNMQVPVHVLETGTMTQNTSRVQLWVFRIQISF